MEHQDTKSLQLRYLKVKCPCEMPLEFRSDCYWNNKAGNCELCKHPRREKCGITHAALRV